MAASSFLGPWATIGSENNAGSLDWATINAGRIVPFSNYATGAAGLWHHQPATGDVKVSTAGTLSAATTVHTVYMTSGGTLSLSSNTLTVGGGGILANGGTNSYPIQGFTGGQLLNANMIGSGGTGSPPVGHDPGGRGRAGAGGQHASNLELNVSNIADAPNPTGSFTAQTANGSNVVTLTAGNTSQLCAGQTVSGLVGSGITPRSRGWSIRRTSRLPPGRPAGRGRRRPASPATPA